MKIQELEDRIIDMSYLFNKEEKQVWNDFIKEKISLCLCKTEKPHYSVMDEYILNKLSEKYWRE